jgi:hypothetical protein
VTSTRWLKPGIKRKLRRRARHCQYCENERELHNIELIPPEVEREDLDAFDLAPIRSDEALRSCVGQAWLPRRATCRCVGHYHDHHTPRAFPRWPTPRRSSARYSLRHLFYEAVAPTRPSPPAEAARLARARANCPVASKLYRRELLA